MRASLAKADSSSVILLVEDFRPLLLAMQFLLESSHYRVLTARTPMEALTLQEKSGQRIDLLLTHVLMHGMTGPELAKRLRAKATQMAVLYMPDHPRGWLDENTSREVVASLLPEPFSEEVLLERVRGALDGRAKGATAGGDSSPNAT